MTQLSRGQEAEEASFAFQDALAALGLTSIEDALAMWDDLPIGAKAATAERWVNQATRYILSRRVEARELGLAYYRLTRALRTGTTINHPFTPNEGKFVTMGQLREEFAALADDAIADLGDKPSSKETAESVEGGTSDSGTSGDGSREPVDTGVTTEDTDLPDQGEEVDDDEEILLEELENLKEELEQMERYAQQEADELLRLLGIENEQRKLAELEKRKNVEDVIELREEIHGEVARRQASATGRMVMNGARGTITTAGGKDNKVKAWVRVSSTGTPCGWCAMLISRGPVYKSSASAGGKRNEETGDRESGHAEYHDNDYCYAVPVYSSKEYNTSPRFALNRRYAGEWKSVTAGLSGDAALSKWRKHIRTNKRQAQVAR